MTVTVRANGTAHETLPWPVPQTVFRAPDLTAEPQPPLPDSAVHPSEAPPLAGVTVTPPEVTPEPQPQKRGPRRWPLLLIASPAAIAIWSGWVELGSMCGFGLVHPLPGIVGSLTINTAITLPVGVEAYGTYALGKWLSPDTPAAARKWAMASALGALLLGMLGQVAYHLLAAAHQTRAPWGVTVVVSCIPVVVVGCAAALVHLMNAGEMQPEASAESAGTASGAAAEDAPASVPADAPASAPQRASARSTRGTRARVSDAAAEKHFAATLNAGRVPSLRQIQRDLKVGQPRAKEIKANLEARVTLA